MKATKHFLLSLSILIGFAQSPAWAHAALESAMPAKNAELATAPKEVMLHFNDALEASFSTIKVLDIGGKSVLTKKATVDTTDPKTLRVPVGTLKSGRNTVEWVGVGHDGHRRTGDYQFAVK